MRSNSNSPPSAITLPDTGSATTRTAGTSSEITASTPVVCRCASLSIRSSMRMAQAARLRKISGAARPKPELKSVTLKGFMAALGDELRDQQRLGQMMCRRAHDVEQGRGPQAEQQHGRGQRGEHEEFTTVEILQCRNLLVRDLAENHALDQPQGIRRPHHQGRGGEECIPDVGLERCENDQKFADE